MDKILVRFEVLTMVTMNLTDLKDVMLCDLVNVYSQFRWTYCCHHYIYSHDGNSRFIWNDSMYLPNYSALHL